MAWFGLFAVGLLYWPVISAVPTQLTVQQALQALKNGGLISYALDHTKCTANLPQHIPAYSWGTRISDTMIFDDTRERFSIELSVTRSITGKIYNMTERPVRFKQVTFMPTNAFVEITDVDEYTPKFLATGNLQCDYNQNGVQFYEQAAAGQEIMTQGDLISSLEKGFNIDYVVNLDTCSSPGSQSASSHLFWSGRIQDYRLGKDGGVESTQVVDSAQKTFYAVAKIMTNNMVRMLTFNTNRLTRVTSPEETRFCRLGDGYRVFQSSET